MAQIVKNLPADAGDARDVGSVPRWGRSPGEGNGNPLQYSCLENPVDRGAWWATVHGVTKSRIQLSVCTRVHTHTHTQPSKNDICEILINVSASGAVPIYRTAFPEPNEENQNIYYAFFWLKIFSYSVWRYSELSCLLNYRCGPFSIYGLDKYIFF